MKIKLRTSTILAVGLVATSFLSRNKQPRDSKSSLETQDHTDPYDSVIKDYRKYLQERATQSQSDFDKSVLTLSGGAIGVSLVVLKDFVGMSSATAANIDGPVGFLIGAWFLWALSLLAVLYSYATACQTMKRAIEDVDEGRETRRRIIDKVTSILNFLSGGCFIGGLVCFGIFVIRSKFLV